MTLIKKKLPEGWEWVTIGDLVELKYGRGLKESERNKDGNISVYGSNGVVGYHDTPLSCNAGIIIGRKGSVGAVHKSDDPFWAIDTTYYIEPVKSIELAYLYYLLKTLRLHSLDKSTSIPGLNRNDVYSQTIPVPPLDTQRKIVSILEKAEATQRLRAEADELMQDLLQSVFLEMFGDPVANPMGWTTQPLEKICTEIFGGGTPSKSNKDYYRGVIPWVTPKDMRNDFVTDSIDHITEEAIQESATKKAPENSLLMVIRSGILKRKLPVAIARCEVTINQDMKAFIFDQKIVHPYFMLYFFKNYQRYLLNKVRSVTADNLEFNQIRETEIIIPPHNLQIWFASIVAIILEMRKLQKEANLEIILLTDSLISNAFTGDLTA